MNPQDLSLKSKIVSLGVTAELITNIWETQSQKIANGQGAWQGTEIWGTHTIILQEKDSALRFPPFRYTVMIINSS